MMKRTLYILLAGVVGTAMFSKVASAQQPQTSVQLSCTSETCTVSGYGYYSLPGVNSIPGSALGTTPAVWHWEGTDVQFTSIGPNSVRYTCMTPEQSGQQWPLGGVGFITAYSNVETSSGAGKRPLSASVYVACGGGGGALPTLNIRR